MQLRHFPGGNVSEHFQGGAMVRLEILISLI